MSGALVVGASGLVGGNLLARLREEGAATGTAFSDAHAPLARLDVRDRGAVAVFVAAARPSVIYLPAAFTNVDGCERDSASSRAVNVDGAVNVAEAARAVGARLVYFSTDYVFDGRSGPYREEDAPGPLSAYGRQKIEAERLVADRAPDALIVRTTVVYGREARGKNFVLRLVKDLKEGKTVRVPDDQIGTPTLASDLADAAARLAAGGARGVWHVAGPDRLSRCAFARLAAEVFGLDARRIEPARTADLGQAAPRPLSAGLVAAKAEAFLGRRFLGARDGLRRLCGEAV